MGDVEACLSTFENVLVHVLKLWAGTGQTDRQGAMDNVAAYLEDCITAYTQYNVLLF